MSKIRIGVDLGGTKIEIAAIGKDGRIVARNRRPTPATNYDTIVDTVRDMVLALETQLACLGTVGVAMPGALSPSTGMIKNSNTVCMIGKPFDTDLEAALSRPIRLSNDANCFALSEAVDGAAAGYTTVFGVIIGTGVGGGIVISHTPLTGANAVAGEWGHNPLPWRTEDEIPGPRCYCGKNGCVETFLSGPALARDHGNATGESLKPQEIEVNANGGDKAAQATMSRYTDRLARGLAGVVNILDPDAIVLGGGLSNIALLYDEVPRKWSKYIFSDSIVTKLVRAAHGDSSGVRGAAWLWPPDS